MKIDENFEEILPTIEAHNKLLCEIIALTKKYRKEIVRLEKRIAELEGEEKCKK